MKHSLFFIMSLGMLPLFLFGCDRSGESQDHDASTMIVDSTREAVLQSLLDADAAWLRSVQVSADSFVSFFADDGLWLYATGSRMTNREEMLAFASEVWSRPGFSLNWEATSVGVTPSYDVGYTAGEWDGSYEAADGEMTEILGSYMAVWKKGESGEWEVTIQIEVVGGGFFPHPQAVSHQH